MTFPTVAATTGSSLCTVIIIGTAYSQETETATSTVAGTRTITAIGFNCIRNNIVSFIQFFHSFTSFHMIVVSNQQ
jgi:hypothetical protein